MSVVGTRHGARGTLVRYVAGVAVGAIVLLVLLGQRGELDQALRHLTHLRPLGVLGVLVAEAASLFAFTGLQRSVLGAAGAPMGFGSLFAVSLANDAIALSLPGEPVVSSAYRYNQYRHRGASPAGAGWAILTAMIAQAVGLSLVLIAGLAVAIVAHTGHVSVLVDVLAVLIVLVAGAVLVRVHLVAGVLEFLVRVTRRLTGHPKGSLRERVEQTLKDVRAIDVRARGVVVFAAWATAIWVADALCLAMAFVAIRESVPWTSLGVAYGVGQIVAVLPLAPGGLGLVEGSLAVVLIAYGAPHAAAVSAVIAYRLVSYWLAIGVGWTAVAGLAIARGRHVRLETAEGQNPVE